MMYLVDYLAEVIAVAIGSALMVAVRLLFLPDGFAYWFLTLLLILLLSIVILIIIATIAPRTNGLREWVGENHQFLFEGLLGHTIVALAAVVVAAGVLDHLDIEYRNTKVCTSAAQAQNLRDIGSGKRPILVHVRDGVGKAKEGQELLVRWRRMNEEDGKYCAWVKYARKLGFQYKIFVEVEEKPSDIRLKSISDTFAPKGDNVDGPPSNAYATIDLDTERNVWRVWVLLKDHGYYAEEDLNLVGAGEQKKKIWNNFFPPSDDI